MKMRPVLMASTAALALLAGCTTDRSAGAGGPGWSRGPGHGPMMGYGGGPGPAMGPGGDGSRMCAFYRQLGEGKSPDEQRAAIEAQMQSMHGGTLTVEQLRVRRETMERYCSGAPAPR